MRNSHSCEQKEQSVRYEGLQPTESSNRRLPLEGSLYTNRQGMPQSEGTHLLENKSLYRRESELFKDAHEHYLPSSPADSLPGPLDVARSNVFCVGVQNTETAACCGDHFAAALVLLEFSKDENKSKGGSAAATMSKLTTGKKLDMSCATDVQYERLQSRKQHVNNGPLNKAMHCFARDHIDELRDPEKSMSSWDERMRELKCFKEKNGHCIVPQNFPQNPKLAIWVKNTRTQYRLMKKNAAKAAHLSQVRIDALNEMGFCWDLTPPSWEQRFCELLLYKAKYGNCDIPRGFKKNVQLARWVNTQRTQYKLLREGQKAKITPERISMLDDVGFVWKKKSSGKKLKQHVNVRTSGFLASL